LLLLQALALEFGERADASHDGTQLDNAAAAAADSTFYEITIATVDQPKLLSRLSDAMVGLVQGCWAPPVSKQHAPCWQYGSSAVAHQAP
jgi:hypothetical protein